MYDANYLQAELDYRRQRIREQIVGHRRRLWLKRQRTQMTRI